MKNSTIIESSYKKLLSEIQKFLLKTQQNITRQKVEMAWKIGKSVEEHLLENRDETYGKHLIERLEKDTKISQTVLYKMRSFYQTYPKLPKNNPSLNWSHYRVLAGISDKDKREYLEDLTKENSWSGGLLQQKVSEVERKKTTKNKSKTSTKNLTTPQQLKFSRGKLFAYKLAKMQGSDQMFVDLGFNIFSEIKTKFSEGEIVETIKKNEKYSLKKSAILPKEMHCYKAYLERVVDGDTLHVSLDLGFNIFHKEILRLAQINAPEMGSKEGKKSFVELKKILEGAPFLIIKTNKTDIYGRYVADVFFEDGVYLNQLLLDRGVVEFVRY